MNEFRTLIIELSTSDWQRLEAEAHKLNYPPEILFKTVMERHLKANRSRFSRVLKPDDELPLSETLTSLREIASQQPVVDAVHVAHESREELIQKGLD